MKQFDVPPDEGTVEIRLRGRPGDLARLEMALTALTGATVRVNRDRSYTDGDGVTVRRYLTADLRSERRRGGGLEPAGPYGTEREAAEACQHVYDAAPAGSGGGMRDLNQQRLLDACDAAGVELGEWDRRILGWVAGYEPSTVQVLVGIISRAGGSAGR